MELLELVENIQKISFDKFPIKGWWLASDPVTFYHGTHIDRIPMILKNGLLAPKEGPTAGWISLALDPATARGYASMSGEGGESSFRAAGIQVRSVPMNERAVIVLSIPQSYFLPRMAPARGAMEEERDKLTNRDRYEEQKEQWLKKFGDQLGKFDTQYYAKTEIRLPFVPKRFIVGYMSEIS